MSHRQSKLYTDLMLSICNSEEGAPCYDRYWLYFPEGDERLIRSAEREAKEVCSTCPFREKCLEYALSAQEPEGVWGGKTVRERERLIAAKREARQKGEKN